MSYDNLTLGQKVTLACMLEVSAPKPGNVHRGADFEDLTFYDFIQSAVAIGSVFERHQVLSLGQLVFAAVEATRSVVSTNTNLGLILLMAPLAKAGTPDSEGVRAVLTELQPEDAELVYLAINSSKAGGLGDVVEMDVAERAPKSLLAAMEHASERDFIAAQYVNGFDDILSVAAPKLYQNQQAGLSQIDAIVRTHVELMSLYPDTLIARKCGDEVARESASRAGFVLEQVSNGEDEYLVALADFDFWLRADQHRRNPGPTADIIGAALLIGLMEGWLAPPVQTQI
ncbi:MAG: triphosphoribosyl-dephospho-CoA synthase [Pirellulales bacterium]|nr:triphosphoribosyl-dephospho-CoA synthase [Pirellulales bacterium]